MPHSAQLYPPGPKSNLLQISPSVSRGLGQLRSESGPISAAI